MSDEQEQPERVWDEYEWERFLQKQDLKTERYLELLEKYADNCLLYTSDAADE